MKSFLIIPILACSPTLLAQCENGVCRISDHFAPTKGAGFVSNHEPLQNPFRPAFESQPTNVRVNSKNQSYPLPPPPQLVAPAPRIAATVDKIEWHQSYAVAVRESRRTGLPMLLKVSAQWCPPCQRLKRETLTDPRVIRTIASGFVAADLDAELNQRLVQQLAVTTLPTILVVSPELKILERKTGFQSGPELNNLLFKYVRRVQRPTETRLCQRLAF